MRYDKTFPFPNKNTNIFFRIFFTVFKEQSHFNQHKYNNFFPNKNKYIFLSEYFLLYFKEQSHFNQRKYNNFFPNKNKYIFCQNIFLLFSKNNHILINANIIKFFQIKTNIFFQNIFTVFKEQSHFNQYKYNNFSPNKNKYFFVRMFFTVFQRTITF